MAGVLLNAGHSCWSLKLKLLHLIAYSESIPEQDAMKRIVIFIIALILSAFSASAVSNPDIKYGPWVQNVTETGFTMMWKSSVKDLSNVEIAPDDGTPF